MKTNNDSVDWSLEGCRRQEKHSNTFNLNIRSKLSNVL